MGAGKSIALAVVAVVLAAAPGTAFAHGANANLRHSPPPSGAFSIAASNGYELYVKSEKGLLTVNVSRQRPSVPTIAADGRLVPRNGGSYTESVYAVRGTPRDPNRIEADLGPLGRIAVSFQPSGEKRVTTVDLSDKTERCTGAMRITRRLGTFAGTISVTGENGYTSVEQTSAPGTVGTSPFRNCRPRNPRQGTTAAASTGAEEAKREAVLSLDGSADLPSMFATGDGHATNFYAISGEPIDGGPSVLRLAHASAGGDRFAFDTSASAATLEPPPPFSGAAAFRDPPRSAPTWSGDLAVEFPGFVAPLTGPGFDSPKLALLRVPAASGPR